MPIPIQAKEDSQRHTIKNCNHHHRFFKVVKDDDVLGQKFHAFSCAHKSLSYHQQWMREIMYGVIGCMSSYPVIIAIQAIGHAYNHKKPHKWYAKHLFDFPEIRMYVRFHAPIVEELVFRGLLLRGLHHTLTKVTNLNDTQIAITSSLCNSLLFSAAHPKGARLHTFIGGLAMTGLTYVFDGSLISAFACHATNNNIVVATHMMTKRFGK